MKQIILLLCIVLIAGCNPCRRLARLCPPTIQHDSVYIETVVTDTVTLVTPSDTTYITVPVVTLESLGIIVENENQIITMEVVEGVLQAEVICKDDSLEKVIYSLRTELRETEVITPAPVEPEKYLTKFAKFTIIYFFCSLFLVVVVGIYRIKVGPLKTALNRLK